MRAGLLLLLSGLLFSACSENSGSDDPVSEGAQNASQSTVVARMVNGDGNGQIALGRCHMGECSWSREIAMNLVEQRDDDRLFKINLLGGTSTMRGSRFPKLDGSDADITWNDKSHEVYVFCSQELPAVVSKFDREWQVDVLDFVNGPPGVLEGSAALYSNYCHGNSLAWTSAGFSSKHGYGVPVSDEILIKKGPHELFSRAKGQATNEGDLSSLPYRLSGRWNLDEGRCDLDDDANDTWLEVDGNELTGYEEYYLVTSIRKIGPDVFEVSANDQSMGENQPTTFSIEIDPNGTEMSTSLRDATLVRCG